MIVETKGTFQKESEQGSYSEVLGSSLIIGGSSVVSIVLGIIRTKVMAVFLGPSGVGLLGIYNSITGTIATLAGMGISNSGVRQIAEAAGTGERTTMAFTIVTLRRTTWVLGIFGGVLLMVIATPISRMTFGDTSHVTALAILSITIFLASIAGGQVALVQGMRRIVDLAKINILGTFCGTALSIPIIYFLREDGVVPMLLIISLMTMLASWWYARSIEVLKVSPSWADIQGEVRALLRLGLVFMSTGLMATAVTYLVRLIIVRRLGIEAVGHYQAAWALSGVYVGFILGAMGTDFYPRLTAVVRDNATCNRLVNEQAEVAMLLAVPGILATVVFAPVVIKIFYSGTFAPAIDLLRWQMLGVLLKVAAWPIGFILLAKGAAKQFMMTETLTHLVSVVSTWFCLHWFGLVGAGVAFFVMYAFCWLIVFMVVRGSYGFRWSTSNCRLATVTLPAVSVAFLVPFWLPQLWATLIGGFLTLCIGILFMKRLFKLIDPSRLPLSFKAIGRWFGLLPRSQPSKV